MTFVHRCLSGPGLWSGLWLAAASHAVLAQTGPLDPAAWHAELQASMRPQQARDSGPLAAAHRIAPSVVSLPADSAVQRAEVRGSGALAPRVGWAAQGLLEATQAAHAAATARSRVNELHLSAELGGGAWQASAGKKIVAWDVGQAWRPNDVVQQEPRRLLLPATPEGKPVLMLEHYGSNDSATSLVWVHPQRSHDPDARHVGAEEGALAGRWYQRHGAADWHAYARLGAHTGASLGASLAWVASDALALHACARLLQRHGVMRDATSGSPVVLPQSPWIAAQGGGTAQWLLGASWTGSAQQTLLAELWHDGTTPSDGEWSAWQRRTGTLTAVGTSTAPPSLATPLAANLAWQAGALASPLTSNLRRDNAYLRASWQPADWQPGRWTLAADLLYTPADHGRALGASLQWQSDRWRIDIAWRRQGGPAQALLAQLPTRSTAVLAATRAW